MVKEKFSISTILMYSLLVLISVSVFIPILWIVFVSFKSGRDLTLTNFGKEFSNLTLWHYKALFQIGATGRGVAPSDIDWVKSEYNVAVNYLDWYRNTLLLAICNTIVGVLLTTITAYIFSRYSFKSKKKIMLNVLILQMFPSFLAMTAIYIIVLKLGMANKLTGLLLVYAAGQIPFNAWLAKGYFDEIPSSLDEAAKIDGAGHLRIFWEVIMPVAKPILVFLAMVNFTAPWFDFIFPRILLTSREKWTLAVGIFDWIGNITGDKYYTLFAAGALLVAIPITILFAVTQKYIVAGLSAGSDK